jgi:excisionase family DNA binding protein
MSSRGERSKDASRSEPKHECFTDRLLDAEQVAEILNMSVKFVRSITLRGELASIDVGRRKRYRRRDVEAYIAHHER